MEKSKKTEKILLRVTPDSKKWLEIQAIKDDRSINSVITQLIESRMKPFVIDSERLQVEVKRQSFAEKRDAYFDSIKKDKS